MTIALWSAVGIVCAVVVSCSATPSDRHGTRIVGGSDVSSDKDYPFMASVQSKVRIRHTTVIFTSDNKKVLFEFEKFFILSFNNSLREN